MKRKVYDRENCTNNGSNLSCIGTFSSSVSMGVLGAHVCAGNSCITNSWDPFLTFSLSVAVLWYHLHSDVLCKELLYARGTTLCIHTGTTAHRRFSFVVVEVPEWTYIIMIWRKLCDWSVWRTDNIEAYWINMINKCTWFPKKKKVLIPLQLLVCIGRLL